MGLPPLHILYGSATGNSEHIAKSLSASALNHLNNTAPKYLFYSDVVCRPLDEWKKSGCLEAWDSVEEGTQKIPVILVCSTTGNGDSPENASRFHRYLKRKSTKR